MSKWTGPSAKMIVASLAAFLGPIAYNVAKVVVDDGPPLDTDGWVRLVAKAALLAFGVGGAGYLKPETNPSPSAKDAAKAELIKSGEVRPA